MRRNPSPQFAIRSLIVLAASCVASSAWAAPASARPDAAGSRAAQAEFVGQAEAEPAGLQARRLDLYMSDMPNGEPKRGFGSTMLHSVYAVVSYEDASSERYDVRVFDLAGQQVKRQVVGPLSGTGKASVEITTDDFVSGYKAAMSKQQEAVQEALDIMVETCKTPPPAPTVWPPQPPAQPTARPGQPTPTPLPPDPYLPFRDAMSESLNRLRTGTAELTRTIQSLTRLPDLGRTPTWTSLDDIRQTLAGADGTVDSILELIKPQQGLPKPVQACDEFSNLNRTFTAAMTKLNTTLSTFPTDTSTWRIPSTSARYIGDSFAGCEAYLTQIYRYVGGSPSETAAKTTNWSVGFPGPPALVFPGPDLVDPNNVGQIGFNLPSGVSALYAKSIKLPDLNHVATLSAFVTDSQCLALDGVSVTFSVNPSSAATLAASRVSTRDGLAEVALEAGNDVAVTASAFAIVCDDPCTAPKPPTGRTRFEVVGPTKRLDIIVSPKELNLSDAGNPARRPGILVRASDAITQGHSVADNTEVKVSVVGPAVLAYDRRPIVNGAVQAPESFRVGKEMTLITENGNGVVPNSLDPGYQNEKRLYLLPDGQAVGCVTVIAEADGVRGDSDDRFADGTTRKSICIVRKTLIFLPFSLKRLDVRATPPGRLPTNTPEPPPTRTPRS